MHIGIFDSGRGGHIVAERLRHLRPNDILTVIDDRLHVPYGSRQPDEIIELTERAIQPLLTSCDVIVLACNTATAVAIEALRARHPNIPFVGFEPMIKTAVQKSKTNSIAILATPATLESARYKNLKQSWAHHTTVLEPDCSTWAAAIEAGTFTDDTAVAMTRQLVASGADIIVLACTHYLKLQESMQQAAKSDAIVLEPIAAINRQIDRLSEAIALRLQ